MQWWDDWVVPVGAPNPTAAYKWINYTYQPTHQAQIDAYTSSVTPVAGVKKIFEKTDPQAANNQLIFPSSKFTANCDVAPTLTGKEEQDVTRAFDAVISG
jgi:spermidine/putrescine transport system substrate-binding protein